MKTIYYNLDSGVDPLDKDQKLIPNNKVVAVTIADSDTKEWNSWSVPVDDFKADDIVDAKFVPVADPFEEGLKLTHEKGYRRTKLDIWK
ncbi:hypothetical protein EFM54_08485 [Lentilactobacillus buchneri]|uniref:hypothetical protein n=1 Tax=Lentilactobacillus buchneri TaxID=1581 RepID=UPI0021A924F9|nr:hypothetical protein [Lentilactobacillus buchneri]MCT2899013.1 hypothetical protein [Lentilactobacillus buchneri]